MVRAIMKDVLFLKKKAVPATKDDMPVVQDLLDTLKANETGCVGMAANMIGVNKRIIAGIMGFATIEWLNRCILIKQQPSVPEGGCLSLNVVPTTTRYQEIEVEYEDIHFKKQHQKYKGWVAQIIQHEVDHCEGIII